MNTEKRSIPKTFYKEARRLVKSPDFVVVDYLFNTNHVGFYGLSTEDAQRIDTFLASICADLGCS